MASKSSLFSHSSKQELDDPVISLDTLVRVAAPRSKELDGQTTDQTDEHAPLRTPIWFADADLNDKSNNHKPSYEKPGVS